MNISDNNNIDKIKMYTPIKAENARSLPKVKPKMISQKPDTATSLPENSDNKDEILLSEDAVQFTKFKERLSALPNVRHDLVAELKSRIQNGSYKVDSEEVADKLIEESVLI